MTTIEEVRKLQSRMKALHEEINSRQKELGDTQHRISCIQRSCSHQYDAVKYDPEIRKGGYFPGDAPGTMGVDWRGPMSIPDQTIPRWSRTCKICGKVEYKLEDPNKGFR
jgi:hypothetical protein